MNSKELLEKIGEARESFVEAAMPQGMSDTEGAAGKRRGFLNGGAWKWIGGAAACLLLGLLALGHGLRGQREASPSEISAADTFAVPAPAPEVKESAAVLYQGADAVVREIREGQEGGQASESAQAKLAAYTDRELLEQADLVIRGRLLRKKSIEITHSLSNRLRYACLLEIEPLRVLKGSLEQEERITVYVPRSGPDTSLYRTEYALFPALEGREGILLLHSFLQTDPGYKNALADYEGWGASFAVWGKANGLALPRYFFSSYQEDWSLDEAEKRTRLLLEGGPKLPADFAFTVDYFFGGGEEVRRDHGFYYNSSSGEVHEIVQSASGMKMRSSFFQMDEETQKIFYDCLSRLADYPQTILQADDALSGEGYRIELDWQAEGKLYHLTYRGLAPEPLDKAKDRPGILQGILREMDHYYMQCSIREAALRQAQLLPYSREGYASLKSGR